MHKIFPVFKCMLYTCKIKKEKKNSELQGKFINPSLLTNRLSCSPFKLANFPPLRPITISHCRLQALMYACLALVMAQGTCKMPLGSTFTQAVSETVPTTTLNPSALIKDWGQSVVYRCWKWVQEADVVLIKHTYTHTLIDILYAKWAAPAAASWPERSCPESWYLLSVCWRANKLPTDGPQLRICLMCYLGPFL